MARGGSNHFGSLSAAAKDNDRVALERALPVAQKQCAAKGKHTGASVDEKSIAEAVFAQAVQSGRALARDVDERMLTVLVSKVSGNARAEHLRANRGRQALEAKRGPKRRHSKGLGDIRRN